MDKQGDRFKDEERRHRRVISSDNLVVMRLDGKAFHTYTRGMKRPFDANLEACMYTAMIALCEEIQGVRLAYTQSDEISLLISAGSNPNSELWMGGVEAKMLSISAAIASSHFNQWAVDLMESEKLALFDSRIALVYPKDDLQLTAQVVSDYFDWRKWDCNRNAITMVAQSFYSHKELNNKSYEDRVKMIEDATGTKDWRDLYYMNSLYGAYAYKETRTEEVSYTRKDSGETHTAMVDRSRWLTKPFNEPTMKVVRNALNI